MNKSLSAVAGMGLLGAVFMAFLSMFYLQQLPSKTDVKRLTADLKAEHGRLLAADEPLAIEIVRRKKEGNKLGLRIVCSVRASIRAQKNDVDNVLDWLGRSALHHPDWEGRVRYVEVIHAAPPEQQRVVRAGPSRPSSAPARAPSSEPQAAAPGSLVGEVPPKR